MNNIIKDESLLSSISNISVMIKPNEGSSIFNFSMLPNHYEPEQSERVCEVKLDDIFPRDDHFTDNNSMLDKIIKKEDKDNSMIPFLPHPIVPQFVFNSNFNEKTWRITEQKGVSEDEGSREEEDREASNDKKLKNETKNIPKNYGKAIISFMQRYKEVVESVCVYTKVPFDDFFSDMLQYKKTINTIADLRKLWLEYKYAKCMRILSNLFFRKYSLSYIFNSRICNFRSHIKYRHRLSEAIRHPQSFRHIKDY